MESNNLTHFLHQKNEKTHCTIDWEKKSRNSLEDILLRKTKVNNFLMNNRF